jgi:hypothetical protein
MRGRHVSRCGALECRWKLRTWECAHERSLAPRVLPIALVGRAAHPRRCSSQLQSPSAHLKHTHFHSTTPALPSFPLQPPNLFAITFSPLFPLRPSVRPSFLPSFLCVLHCIAELSMCTMVRGLGTQWWERGGSCSLCCASGQQYRSV